MVKNSSKPVEIIIRKAGPIVVKGDVVLKDNDGNLINLQKLKIFSICGCMKSRNGVFCDGSHNKP